MFLDYFPSPTRILHEIQNQLLLQPPAATTNFSKTALEPSIVPKHQSIHLLDQTVKTVEDDRMAVKSTPSCGTPKIAPPRPPRMKKPQKPRPPPQTLMPQNLQKPPTTLLPTAPPPPNFNKTAMEPSIIQKHSVKNVYEERKVTNKTHATSNCHCKVRNHHVETKSVGCGTDFVSKKSRKSEELV